MSSLTAWIDWAAENPANRPAYGENNRGQIHRGDRVKVDQKLLRQIVTLRQEDPGVAEAFDLLIVELSKLFEEWKGRGDGFVFRRPGKPNGVVIALNLRGHFRVRVADLEISRNIADKLIGYHDKVRLWHRHDIAVVADSIWFSRLLATEIQPWTNSSLQLETVSLGQGLLLPILGRPYVDVDENVQIAPADAFTVDPSDTERGWRGHRITQNKLAAHVRRLGAVPQEPDSKPFYSDPA